MSTRCNIHFNHGKTVHSNIYRHHDGYPGEVIDGVPAESGVLSDLLEFFQILKAEVREHRLGDAEYLAAKFLVWQSQQLMKYSRVYKPAEGPRTEDGYGPEHPLQFSGVAPCLRDHGDIEYIYEVDCDKGDAGGIPGHPLEAGVFLLAVQDRVPEWPGPKAEGQLMNRLRRKVELALLRMRASHKEIELDETLQTGWGWREPRLQLWALNMLIEECEEEEARSCL